VVKNRRELEEIKLMRVWGKKKVGGKGEMGRGVGKWRERAS